VDDGDVEQAEYAGRKWGMVEEQKQAREDARIENLLARMTLEEKLGQLAQDNAAEGCEDLIRTGRIGSFVACQGVEYANRLQRITLEPGEKKTVEFSLSHGDLGFYNCRMEYAVEPGRFRVWVGSSSEGELEGGFEVVEA
jgi:hypothetical protein